MTTYFCIKCGSPKDEASLQRTIDPRWMMGLCPCTRADAKGNRASVVFALTHVTKAKWGHGDGATKWCAECIETGSECGDSRPAPGSMLCYCGHNITKR